MLCLEWCGDGALRVLAKRYLARDSGAERAIAAAYLISHVMSKMRAAMAWESWADCLRQLNLLRFLMNWR
jgi:hypothetical protein